MDPIPLLEWLLEHAVSALLRVDAQRDGIRPWTFHACGGPLTDIAVRVDANTAEECLSRARKALKKERPSRVSPASPRSAVTRLPALADVEKESPSPGAAPAAICCLVPVSW
jgi:hypothetical protein